MTARMEPGVRSRLRALVAPGVVSAVIIGAWYALAYTLPNNFASSSGAALIVPPPHRLFEGINAATWSRIGVATRISLVTSLTGLALAAAVGVLLGVVMSLSRTIERAVWPWLIAVQVTPIIVLTPLIVRVMGASFSARVFVTVLIAFFPIASNTLFGIRGVDPHLRDVFRIGGAGRAATLRHLELPAALPAIMAGLRVSAGLAVIGAIVGDFFFTRGDAGLGKLITFFFLDTRAGPMFVTALIATGIGVLFFLGFALVTRLTLRRWQD